VKKSVSRTALLSMPSYSKKYHNRFEFSLSKPYSRSI
jgi:hypothetical protein